MEWTYEFEIWDLFPGKVWGCAQSGQFWPNRDADGERGQQAVQLSETKIEKLNVQGDTGFWKIHSAKNSRLNVAFRL